MIPNEKAAGVLPTPATAITNNATQIIARNGIAEQAAQRIEGEAYSAAYLQRLQAGTALPGELSVIVAFLQGEMLHGACRLIEKALEGKRHA